MQQGPRLFSSGDLHPWLRQRETAAASAADAYPREAFVTRSTDELTVEIVDRFAVTKIQLDEAGIEIQDAESRVRIQNYGIEASVPAMVYTVFIPFTGESALLGLAGSHISAQPRGHVSEGEIVLSFEMRSGEPQAIRERVQRELSGLRLWLDGQVASIDEFTGKLGRLVRQGIERRQTQLAVSSNALASSGFKIRSRGDAARFIPPIVRQKVVLPAVRAATSPTLDEQTYAAILKVVRDAMMAAERSPSVFKDMGEEDLRQIILLFLNAVFEGETLAEAFNFAGKTDLLIRHGGQNIFVAECKFWTGPKSLADAITQLLGYTTWRDTKTAVVLFNRRTAITTVSAAIPAVLKEHPYFVQEVSSTPDAFRAVFRREQDPDARVATTVLLFDLPRDVGP